MKKKSASTTRNVLSVYRVRAIVLVLLLGLTSSCANYADRIVKPRAAFDRGDYASAIEDLKKLTASKDNDELLYWMDLGTVYHTAGRYAEAIEAFTQADKLAQLKDYTSVTAEAGAVILNDTVKQYQGEDFEKILVNVYMAIDYALLGQWESALVESRRVNNKLDTMIQKGKRPYENNAFAKYLAGALFEAQREDNDAFVDYRQLYKWKGKAIPYLGVPLLRLADRLRATQEYEQYRKAFPEVGEFRLGKGQGEIILLLEVGRSPVKVPSPQFHLVPIFRHSGYSGEYGLFHKQGSSRRVKAESIFDIEATATKELGDRAAGIIAKKIGGVVAKEAAAYGVAKATDSELAGLLTSLVLHLSDTADLRSWTTLPARLHLARLTLPAGRHDLVLDMVVRGGVERSAVKVWKDVEVKPGKIQFLHYRDVE